MSMECECIRILKDKCGKERIMIRNKRKRIIEMDWTESQILMQSTFVRIVQQSWTERNSKGNERIIANAINVI